MSRTAPGRTMRRVLGLTVALCALIPAAAANAVVSLEDCDGAELSRPFAQFGDPAQYKLAPGGDFEGAHGWTLSGGAKVASGSEPWGVTGKVGAKSLVVPAGGSATSPATCVNAAYPTFRFFSKSSGGLLGLLPAVKVEVLYGEGLAQIVALPAGVALPSSGWIPNAPMLTSAAVGAALAGGEAPIAIRITSVSGTWSVDDVFVDPYRRS